MKANPSLHGALGINLRKAAELKRWESRIFCDPNIQANIFWGKP